MNTEYGYGGNNDRVLTAMSYFVLALENVKNCGYCIGYCIVRYIYIKTIYRLENKKNI